MGSNLECDDSTFDNPSGFAIRADRITVIGSVYLRNKFASKGAVRFPNAQMGLLDCSGGKFEGDGDTALNAEEATISGCALFDGAVILGAVKLGYATIRRAFLIKRIVTPQHSRWDLRNASADSLDVDDGSWPSPGNLLLDGFTYQRFGSVTEFKSRLRWLELDTSNPPRAYRELASVYSRAGEMLNSRETLFHLEDLLHRRRIEVARCVATKVVTWVWGQCLKLTIGYGYRLWLSLCWLAPVCALGWAISYWGYFSKAIVPTDKDAYTYSLHHGYVPSYYPRFSATMFTIEHSFPALNLGMSGSWSADGVPQTSRHAYVAKGVRIWFSIQRISGWLLSIFFVAGITGLVKSDK